MKNNRSFAFVITLISFSYMFQGCSIYHKSTTTIQNSVEAGQKVKVIMTDGKKFHFYRLDSEGDKFYGVTKVRGEETRVLLNENDIKEIHLKAKGASTGMSVLLGLGIFTGILMLLAANMTYL